MHVCDRYFKMVSVSKSKCYFLEKERICMIFSKFCALQSSPPKYFIWGSPPLSCQVPPSFRREEAMAHKKNCWHKI